MQLSSAKKIQNMRATFGFSKCYHIYDCISLCLKREFLNLYRNENRMTPTSNSQASQTAAWNHMYLSLIHI